MSEQGRKSEAAKFRSPWNLVLVLAGLAFAGIGAALIASGFDTASKVIGFCVGIVGLYVLTVGLRRGVVVDESGIVVRQGLRSSEPVPWGQIASIDAKKTNYLLVWLCVPVLSLNDGHSMELHPLSYYRIRPDRESRYVKRISEFLENSR